MTQPTGEPDPVPAPNPEQHRRSRICPQCGQPTLEEDTWGERSPVTGLLYAEPRLYCPSCHWLQPR